MNYTQEDVEAFKEAINENRYNFVKLAYIIFPFGQENHELESAAPYDWQLEEWRRLSIHLQNPMTRFETYRLIISSGNGAAKTAFGAMTLLMLMYTQKMRARITANTDPQMKSVVWPEYDIWFRRARFNEVFFEKLGTSIKARNEQLGESWRLDTVTWSESSPASISGLHNKGHAVMYIFEEAPGIPANIWQYASGAFTETETIKLFFAFGNSDDPESKFEQNMTSPIWRARRIDTRTLSHIDPKQVQDWLTEAGGDEDNDDFRVRVRGLPRKTAKDSIIKVEVVKAAIDRRIKFDKKSVEFLPCILSCDPAWTGGDETVIWYRQGNYSCLLEKYKLDKTLGETHQLTYAKLCEWERNLGADAVFIDQGEGTAIYTLAINAQKTTWELVAFNSSPNDNPVPTQSAYKNIRAQMYYQADDYLRKQAAVIDVHENHDDETRARWLEDILRQLCWTKGTRHKVTQQKLAEPKLDIKARVGQSPDIADGFVLLGARKVTDRVGYYDSELVGDQPLRIAHASNDDLYDQDTYEASYRNLYDD